MQKFYLIIPLLLLLACNAVNPDLPPFTGEISDDIQLNQVGIYPGSQLRFSVVAWSALKDSLAPAYAPENRLPIT